MYYMFLLQTHIQRLMMNLNGWTNHFKGGPLENTLDGLCIMEIRAAQALFHIVQK